jgi:hypothetical protein
MRRWRPGQFVLAVLLAPAACARGWSGPIAHAYDMPPGCPPDPASESCFDIGRGLLTRPLIASPGRILVVTDDGLRERHGMKGPYASFVIEEITLAGHADVAEGYCPRLTEPAVLAQLASGEVVIVCSGVQSIASLGVVDRARHSVDWRWRIPIEGIIYGSDARVVQLGQTIGIVYPVWIEMHVPEQWTLALPDGSGRSLDRDLKGIEQRELIALVSAGEDLRILFAGATKASELTLGPSGATKMVRTEEQLGPFAAGTPSRDCLARGSDGTVTITLPAQRIGPDLHDDNFGLLRGNLTVRYPNARLSNGADADPSPDGRCVGPDEKYPVEPDELRTGWWHDHPIRATRVGRRELIVYESPLTTADNGTLRVERR